MKRINVYSVKMVKDSGALYEVEKKIKNPVDAAKAIEVVLDLSNEAVEKFGILTLNTKNEIAGIHIVSVGSLNASIVHPREVFKLAVLNNANSIICFHNHPSGDPTPSKEDLTITKRLVEAGDIMGIKLYDHVIVGENGLYVSVREEGLVDFL